MSELTKEQAAARAGVSTKAIERWVRAGKLDQRFRPQAGTSPVAIYLAEDVDRIIATRRPGPPTPFLVPDGPKPPTNGNGHGSAELPIVASSLQNLPADAGPELLRLIVGALVQVWTSQTTSQTLSPEERAAQYVDLKQASAIKQLSQAYLRRRIEEGTLKAIRDRGWRIRRTDLEQL
jgi:hypothetical protein